MRHCMNKPVLLFTYYFLLTTYNFLLFLISGIIDCGIFFVTLHTLSARLAGGRSDLTAIRTRILPSK